MPEAPASSFAVTHIGLVVPDIEACVRNYERIFGFKAPAIGMTDTAEKTHILYKGKPTQARVRLVHIPMGPIRVELLQPVDGPSVWRDALDRGGGVQHIAIHVKDGERELKALEAAGMPLIQQGDYTGGRYTYVDSEKLLGVGLEFTENR